MTASPQRPALIHPVADWFLVGGLSWIFIGLATLMAPPLEIVLSVVVVVVLFVNFPHFAHSYQLLYANFREKCTSAAYGRSMNRRYIFAGVVVPALLATYAAITIITKNMDMMSLAIHGMLFTVGWHYAKQSYGMLIVLSSLHRVFYTAWEKKIILANSYVMWGVFWLLVNRNLQKRELMDIPLHLYPAPDWVMQLALGVGVITATASIWAIARRAIIAGKTPVNAWVGYSTTFAWLLFRPLDPVLYVVIPVFHSLQYLPFVYRFKWNQFDDQTTDKRLLKIRFALFTFTGIILGIAGFIAVPYVLDKLAPYPRDIFGPSLFAAIFLLAINIHHYFIDNVLWRKENPDVSRYLFGNKPAPTPPAQPTA